MNENLIECGDHKWAPFSVLCVHLISGDSNEWVPIDSQSPEVDFDWLCPACADTIENPNLEDLKVVCIHCVRKLRIENDPNFKEEI